MATLVKTPSSTWKAVIRKTGWPVTAKTFRTKRDATDWARRTEDEMVRSVYIDRGPCERITLKTALARYQREVSPAKEATTQQREKTLGKTLTQSLGSYALAAITPESSGAFSRRPPGGGKIQKSN